jgi:hypothetical protein
MPAASPTILAALSGPDERLDLALEGANGRAQLDDPSQQVAGESGDRFSQASERDRERRLGDGPTERAGRWLGNGQLDDEPAQTLFVAGPFADEVVAIIDQQAQLSLWTIERCHRQVRFAQDGAGHGERIDRVALARFARRTPGASHQLGWDAHDVLAGPHELGIEPP